MSTRRVATGFLGVVRSIYLALLGFSPITIGLLLSFGTLVSAFHHISFGVLSDRYGRKLFLVLGALFSASRFVIFAVTRDFWLIALGEGLGAMGEGVGAGQPVVSGYIADKVKATKRVSVFSTLAIANAISTAIGSAIAGMPQLFETSFGMDLVGSHAPLFMIGVLFSSLSFILLLPIEDVSPKEVEEIKVDKRALSVKSRDMIMKFSLVRSTSGLGWGLIESLLPLYFFMRFDVGSDVLGPVFAATRLISVVTYPSIPLVVAKLGEIGTLTSSRVLSALVTVAFAYTDWCPLALVLLVVYRLVLMFSMPIRQSFATKIVDPGRTATAIGISSFARMGVRSVAPTMAGYMFEFLSLSMPFLIGSTLMFLNGLLYYTCFRERTQQRNRSPPL